MTDQEDCTFCQIIAHHIPASVVYDDELVMVFLTIQPVNPGHLLVVPHQHAENLADLPDSTVAHMFVTAARMAESLKHSGIPCQGTTLMLAEGEAADQNVMHAHVHVFPRVTGDQFQIQARWFVAPTPAERDALCDDIQQAAQKLGWLPSQNHTLG